MALELAKAYVQIIPSAKGISSSLSKELGGPAESAGHSAGGKIGSAIKAAIASAGIGAAIKSAVSEGAALEQSIGGIETLFKGSADTVIANAKKAYETAGMSANAYMEAVTGFSASLLQGLGGDTERAAAIADMALTDMSDNANKMGTSMESIQNAYQGFAKQNYTMLDNLKLGYGGTKTEMERLLADAQKLTGVKYDINNLADVYEAIHAIQENLDITGTTAKEASSTISGSFASMKAAFQDTLANLALGEDIAPSLDALKETVITYVSGNLLPALSNILSSLPTVLFTLISTLAPDLALAGMEVLIGLANGIGAALPELLPQAFLAISTFSSGLISNIPRLISAGGTLLSGLASGISRSIPVVAASIPVVIDKIVSTLTDGDTLELIIGAGVVLLTSIIDGLPEIIAIITGSLPIIVDNISSALTDSDALSLLINAGVTLITSLIGNLPEIISIIGSAIPEIIDSITSSLTSSDAIMLIVDAGVELMGSLLANTPMIIAQLLISIPEIIQSIVDAIVGRRNDIIQAGKDLLSGLGEGIVNAIGSVVESARQAANAVLNKVKNVFGIASPSKEMAWMGQMLDAGLAKGIAGNTKPISNAIQDITKITTGALESKMTIRSSAHIDDQTQAAPAESLIEAIYELILKLETMKVLAYLDPAEVDNILARRNALKARGVTV